MGKAVRREWRRFWVRGVLSVFIKFWIFFWDNMGVSVVWSRGLRR